MSISLAEKLEEIKLQALQKLKSNTLDETSIEAFRVEYLGKQGKLTQILKDIGSLSSEQRPAMGRLANEVKHMVAQGIETVITELKRKERSKNLLEGEMDLTLPSRARYQGHRHLISKTITEISHIFSKYGFQVGEGPEIESEYYNFDALNTPAFHPARDMHDTFYITEKTVLRTHTSPVQIRTMEKFKPPLRIIAPGTVYRHDDDASHSPMFHQIEGLWVDTHVSMGHLKGLITAFVQTFFSASTQVQLRPSYFPFTEPSAELDIECVFCKGKGCTLCKQSGWLEVAGCGMVHPNVFKAVHYDVQKISGCAFGMGIERLVMLRHRIPNIKLLYENDIRFLRQF
ncbi:MAG: phenylalanine--tRNA ligase subunit alpha [Deltaproteobacteria bacterium]|nr:phenylalanine--tRNA ligase subunit alpha [Deltaproteobacteria bacterium]